MTDFTNFAENAILDHLFRGQSLPVPASWSIALLTAVADAEAGSVTEVTGGSYARQPVARSLAAMSGTQGAGSTAASTGTGGRTSNNAALTFGGLPAATITHVAWFDAATGGNAWIVRALTTPRTVLAGDSLVFNADALAFTLS